jgi:hypothetical protein
MLQKLNFIIILVLNSITEFERKIENKNNLRKQKYSTNKNDTLPQGCRPHNSSHQEGERKHTCKTTIKQSLSN